MENESLIPIENEHKINGYTKQKKIKAKFFPSYSCYLFLYLMVFSIFMMQIFMITYLIILGKYAQELNLFNFNVTETQDYVSKFKVIIDNVCSNFINCTLPSHT